MRYEIDLDADSIFEIDPTNATNALTILANDANTSFTNVTEIASRDTTFFCATRRFAFDATPDDVRAYLAYYDADDDVITPA